MIENNSFDINPDRLSPLALAFIGDTVFDLLVRGQLIAGCETPVKEMHRAASAMVCARAQSVGVKKILPVLTQEEHSVFLRGRNSHPGAVPKNQTSADYHYATGLESLFGWLYLKNRFDRIKELFSIITVSD